tara:strand:+ start:3075 stop:4640 length:1566 start_codon:yes stop_codon:yes gene_type:complete
MAFDHNASLAEGDLVEYLEEGEENVLLFGKAGSGKSVQLRRFAARNKDRVLRVAPTGIAALNCGGATIHRVFRLPIHPIVDKPAEIAKCAMKAGDELKQAHTLLVDEIGMVRTDVWDCIDKILRIVKRRDEPFGGMRIIGFGDLYQLPPIVRGAEESYFKDKYGTTRGYFFCSPAMREYPFKVIELTRVFRQRDDRFIQILNSARVGKITTDQLALLNSRYRPDFKAAEGFVTLCPRNATADAINSSRLASLPGKEVEYVADYDEGFPKNSMPTDEFLTLKVGCQVMVIKNLYPTSGEMIPNGKVGLVKELHSQHVIVDVDGRDVDVGREEWESHTPVVHDGKLDSDCTGTFEQIPLKIAYAGTIHRSQGVTMDKCIIDMDGGAFADGQTYVALSRCRSLDGIILKSKLVKGDIRSDETLTNFMSYSQMRDRYVEFIQDVIEEVDGKVVKKNHMDIIREGGRTGEWVTEEELSAINEVLLDGNESEALDASRFVLPRLVDELRCLRTETLDLKLSAEKGKA